MSQTLISPLDLDSAVGAGRWMITIFNNDYNSFEDVIGILMDATGCCQDEAEIEAWEAHTYGKASVHFAGKIECDLAAQMISSIGVKTEVSPEWRD